MTDAVLDSSAVLAVINREPGGAEVAAILSRASLSAVSLAEIFSKLADKGLPDSEARTVVDGMALRSIPFDADQARLVGAMRTLTRRRGLSLADNACLALAQSLGLPALTADRAWAGLDIGVEVSLIR